MNEQVPSNEKVCEHDFVCIGCGASLDDLQQPLGWMTEGGEQFIEHRLKLERPDDFVRFSMPVPRGPVPANEEGASAHEPAPAPVAWRKCVDTPYELRPRYVFCENTGIGAAEGWEPLYAAPPGSSQPPADDLPVHTVVESLHDERRKRCFEGECARTACTNRPAVYFNSSTLWYYCGSCAAQINRYAQKELCVIAPGGAEALARAGSTKGEAP